MADNKTIHILSVKDPSASDEYKHYMLNTTTGDWEGNISSFPNPTIVKYGTFVVYNNDVHWLGGFNDPYHYKWNGTEWVEVSTLPYNAINSCAVVFNNEIHLLGAESGSFADKHYKWDGTSWTQVSTMPEPFAGKFAVVYDNAIHILGGQTNNKHYKWNGTQWIEVSVLPYNVKYNRVVTSGVVVYDNAIHIIGGHDNDVRTNHYKWNGTTWTEVSTLPYTVPDPIVIVFDNKIHLLGGNASSKPYYTWDGTSWAEQPDTPWGTLAYANTVVYDYDYIVEPTKHFVDYDNATALMEGINQSKENRFRYSTMPTPSADWLGKSIQYIGSTTAIEPIYTHNYFYECKTKTVEGQTVYYWDSTEPTIKPITNAQIDAWWNGGN